MFLNEEDEILLRALLKYIEGMGESKAEWERRLAEAGVGGLTEEDQRVVFEAMKIAFRNQATA